MIFHVLELDGECYDNANEQEPLIRSVIYFSAGTNADCGCAGSKCTETERVEDVPDEEMFIAAAEVVVGPSEGDEEEKFVAGAEEVVS